MCRNKQWEKINVRLEGIKLEVDEFAYLSSMNKKDNNNKCNVILSFFFFFCNKLRIAV